MLRGATWAPIARPKRMARSTAPRFATGSVPGSARSTADACVFGSAPNAVAARLKILLAVDSWVWVSKPMTTSQPWINLLMSEALRLLPVMIGGELEAVRHVQQQRLAEVVADQLQAHRHAARAEAAGHA